MPKQFGVPTKAEFRVPLEVGVTYLDRKSYLHKYHLWIVALILTDGDTLVFNATEHEDGCDETCILQPGESGMHPFIHKKSIILYSHYEVVRPAEVEYNVSHYLWIPREKASDELVRKVCLGAVNSQYVATDHKEALRSAYGLPTVEVIRRRRRNLSG